MKRCILFLIGWLLCLSLRAQAPQYQIQYWFDGDYSAHVTDSSNGEWQRLVDVSHLSIGVHTMSLHIQDTSGRWSSPRTFLFYNFDTLPSGSTNNALTAWFDYDYSHRMNGPIRQGNILIDCNGLSEGFHTLNLMTGSGTGASLRSYMFYKVPHFDTLNQSVVYHAWFDDDYDQSQSGLTANGGLLLNAQSLSDGFHTLNLVLNTGSHTTLKSAMFYKLPVRDSLYNALTYTYWIDNDYQSHQHGEIGSGNLLIDLSHLSEGFHTMNMTLGEGKSSRVQSWMFYKTPIFQTSDSSRWYWKYSIDGQEYPAVEVHPNGGIVHFDINAGELHSGFHNLSYFLLSENGSISGLNSTIFYKTPDGGNGFKRYEYWVNDDEDQIRRVDTERSDTLRVMALLPVDPQPIRSSCFHFDPNNGLPIIYAKNNFHFRAWNTEDRYAEFEKQYVDYHVSQAVVSDTILPFVAETFPKVSDNSIKWFRLTSRIGDSLAFKSNGPCTIQLFDPEGQEVYRATDNMATTFGGTHAWHNGTYYLAVHDATYSGNANLVVEYQHYDKYAVLAQDVDRVGNGGLSAITFKGNGFDGIANVLAVHGTDTLPCHYHTDSNRTEMKVVWNFEDATIGQYSLALCFVDDTIVLNNALTVETAREIILASNVSYPSSFLRGSTVTYTLEVTNTGNMTAFYVPLYIYIGSEHLSDISMVKLNGLGLSSLAEIVGTDSISAETIQILNELDAEIGDDHRFVMYEGYDSIDQRYKATRSNYFFLSLNPYETKTIQVTLTATNHVEVFFTIPDSIQAIRIDRDISSYACKNGAKTGASDQFLYRRNQYCCIKDRISCVLSAIADVSDILSLFPFATGISANLELTNCISSELGVINDMASAVLCSGDEIDEDEMAKALVSKIEAYLSLNNVVGIVFKCFEKHLPAKKFQKLIEAYKKWDKLSSETNLHLGIIIDRFNCDVAYSQMSPGCPPDPPQGGGSNPQAPVDPNEIIGYLASSGSSYIPASVQTVNYEIECENEVEFATSAAHTVTVVDTLSSALFDLSTFEPTQVKIGQHTHTLDGTQNQVATIDLRPEVSAIAEVSVTLDTATGVARWVVATLDPITFAPITDPAIGVLPPNTDGSGVASFAYRIDLRNPVDGAVIPNRAYITFDNEAPIATPVWTNTIDAVAPTSRIAYAATAADSITMSFAGSDNRSGLWRYELYGRQDSLDSWRVVAPNISHSVFAAPVDSTVAEYYVVAIDSAGNRESKTPQVEYSHAGGVVGPTATTYQIRFANYDNALLQTYHMPLGAMPAYLGGVPTRLADSHYSYRFSGWNPSLQPVTGNTVYHAVYDSIPNRYCVRFYDYDSTLLYWDSIEYGYTPTYQGVTPTHAAVDTFVYAFAGWSPALRPITGDADYRPVFDSMPYGRVPLYAVAFVNWNDTILQSDSVPFGSTPHYWGTEPTRTADARCNYRFAGWSPSLLPARGNVTYRAMFDTIVQHYPITFVNFNGAVLQQEMVAYGEMPVYHGNVPTRRSSFLYSYSFAGWSPNLVTVSNEAVYTATFDSALRCTTQYQYEDITTCEPITWRDRLYTATGTYSQQVENVANGCDSIYVLNLTVNSSSSSSVAQVVCDSYSWHGHTYTASTVVKDTLTNSVGCDSVITLNLTVNHSSTGVQYATACDSYTWNGSTYTTSTSTPTMIEQNAAGCDSVITLNLTVNHSSTGVQYATACDSYTWNGITYTTSTSTPTMTEQNVAGCDSVITLNLTVNHSSTGVQYATACDSYTWNGITYTTSTSTPTMIEQNAAGCDSVITLNLTVNYSSEGTDILSACDSLTWIDGITYTISTQEPRFTLVNEDGCDSVISLALTVNYSSETEETFTISDGDLPYSFGGQLFEDYGYYDVLLQSEAGCDSVIHLYLNRSSENEIDNSDVHSINIYPNPTNGWVYIHSDEVENVIVMDLLGRKVAQCESNQIDLSKIPSGNYYLFITTHNGLTVKRIVKR